MNNYFEFDKNQQRYLLEQATGKIGLPAQAIEKDIWVTTILQIVFTLPFSEKVIFKGGTSLSKVWNTINRFSEDIDLSVDRSLFGLEGDLTKKQLKKLRKASSVFVREDFKNALQQAIKEYDIERLCVIEAEPDGEGDGTYPEPRKLFLRYESALGSQLSYLKPVVMLEIGSRSLFEPNKASHIQSMVETNFSTIRTSLVDASVRTAVPEKTFLEKAFLLHELFTTDDCNKANRKSRHLYDLERMMDCGFAIKAIADDKLWNSIHHHREVFTHMSNVDYTPDIRDRIMLTPPEKVLPIWKSDYVEMQQSMIYGNSLSFNQLMDRMKELEIRFRSREQ